MIEKYVCETTIISYSKRKPGEESSQRKPAPSKLIYGLLVSSRGRTKQSKSIIKRLQVNLAGVRSTEKKPSYRLTSQRDRQALTRHEGVPFHIREPIETVRKAPTTGPADISICRGSPANKNSTTMHPPCLEVFSPTVIISRGQWIWQKMLLSIWSEVILISLNAVYCYNQRY